MKSLFEQQGGTYHLESNYLVLSLALPAEEDTAEFELYQTEQKNFLHQLADKWEDQQLSC